jgi:hypothetical protein
VRKAAHDWCAADAGGEGLHHRQRLRVHQPRLQVHGGHGYIREWGIEQYVRDARINMIYEGTNTIQSLDLLGRKVLGDGGAKLRKFGEMIRTLVEEHGTNDDMAEFVNPLADLGDKFEKLSMEIGMKAFGNPTRRAPRRSTTCASSDTW